MFNWSASDATDPSVMHWNNTTEMKKKKKKEERKKKNELNQQEV